MIKHIVPWNWADNIADVDKEKKARLIKTELENLINLIPGIISIKVYTKPLQSSNFDLLLDCQFESEEALKAYQVHPEHLRAANTYVRPVVKERKCIDVIMD